jgi:signal transduction histidine kinase
LQFAAHAAEFSEVDCRKRLTMNEEAAAPIKFLIVGDLEDDIIELKELLARPGLELLTASSGREALHLLHTHDIALALILIGIGVHMPEMGGFELAKGMRGAERSRRVPTIFVSAEAPDQHRIFQGYDAGAVDFLYKPFDRTILHQKTTMFFELGQEKQRLDRQLGQLSEDKERLTAELKETLRLNETFVAAITHDLGNPLSAILMSADAILQRTDDPVARRAAERVRSSGKRMSGLMDALYDLARARLGGGIPIAKSDVDLLPRARKVVGERLAVRSDRPIHFEADGDFAVHCDVDRFEQLLSNLLSNALRHGRPEGVISVRLDGRAADHIELSVRSAGHIDPHVLPYIFDAFRAAPHQRGPSQGLGLGLFIVQQIVKGHGGSVVVESQLEVGTTFRVILPRAG